ncbi:MAG: GDYXXLXY domain-containing protein [Coleofasciculaceae cyanobacterium]
MNNDFKLWRFWLPLLFQTGLILAVPAQAIYTQLTGKTVILQTIPVDPYELLQGYSQTLKYDISNQDSLRKLPGWQELPKQQPTGSKLNFIEPGTHFYVTLAEPLGPPKSQLPQAWKPIAVSLRRPVKLQESQVALAGVVKAGSIQYGLERYYIPEDQREQINNDLRQSKLSDPTPVQLALPLADSPQQPKPPVVMEIKVNNQGNAVPIGLWARLGDGAKPQIRQYRF